MDAELSPVNEFFAADPCLSFGMFDDPILGEDQMKCDDKMESLCSRSPSGDSGYDGNVSPPYSLKSDDEMFEELLGDCFLPTVNEAEPEPIIIEQVVSPPSPKKSGRIANRPKIVFVKTERKPAQEQMPKVSPVVNDTEEFVEEKNRKNAIQAKMNREKKKAYITDLENDVKNLSEENKTLKTENEQFDVKVKSLEEEVAYLKGVLANQSTLAGLLKNIPNMNGVNLSTSFLRKRNAHVDHDYPKPTKNRKVAATNGICLHVEKDNVSIEFCASCSAKAKMSAKDQAR